MENQPLTNNQQFEKLPNATAVLILGICSILFGCVFLALSKKPMMMYRMNPMKYVNFGALNAGRILSIIGVILGAIAIIWGIISALFLGGSFLLFDSDLFEDLLDF